MENTSLKLANKQLQPFANWLTKLELSGKQSRFRTKFLRLVAPHLNEVDNERRKLARSHADTDDKGEPIVKKTDGGVEHYQISPEKQVEFYNELNELMKEEFVIDLLDSNKEILDHVKEILLSTEYEFSGAEAEWYDDVCTIFESHDFSSPKS